ncbi:LytTR family DNA-binding domain-containing protein [Sphingobacterium multivorum]|uniref:LytTR family DNA-binding domain-containing protein n=1 Tax=Sphingobacterium multivorum TaxID=28454 RepID=UPI0031BBAB31
MIYKKPVLSYLNSIIPEIVSIRELFIYAFLLGLSAYVFLLVFQPFGTYNFEHAHKFSLLSGYGVILSFAYVLISILLRKKRGTVGIELIRIFLVFLLSSFLNFVYHGWIINKAPLQWDNLPYIGCYTLSLYSPIATIYFLLRVDKRHSHHKKNNSPIGSLSIKPAMILSQGNDCHLAMVDIPNGSQLLKLLPSDFIFAKSMDNYCMIYFRMDGAVKKRLVRITLSRLSELFNTKSIHRCHRSFLVNFEKIIVKEGNAKGFLLRFADTEDCAVISRSALKSVSPYL